jgi:hypothetical protein
LVVNWVPNLSKRFLETPLAIYLDGKPLYSLISPVSLLINSITKVMGYFTRFFMIKT